MPAIKLIWSGSLPVQMVSREPELDSVSGNRKEGSKMEGWCLKWGWGSQK